MALFLLSGVLRGFSAATYMMYASPETLVRPCSEKKRLIYESDTLQILMTFMDRH